MAYFMPNHYGNPRVKRWRAKAKRDGIAYHLGYFHTREEAEAVEREFDLALPSRYANTRRRTHANQPHKPKPEIQEQALAR